MSFDALPSTFVPMESAERRRRWTELFLIAFLAFSGSVLRSVEILRNGPSSVTDYGTLRWLNAISHKVGLLLLLGYVLWRGGRSFRDIGFRWSLSDGFLGIPLYLVSRAFYFLAAYSIGHVHYFVFGAYPPRNSASQIFGHMPLIALLDMLINPFYEELLVRAYLMTEIQALSGSMTIAALVSLIVQTSYHLYYGWWTAVSLGISFIAFAGYFAKWRRALPIVVAHTIADLVGYFRLR